MLCGFEGYSTYITPIYKYKQMFIYCGNMNWKFYYSKKLKHYKRMKGDVIDA